MRFLLVISFILSLNFLQAQEELTVEATGVGIEKADALQDALRNAVGQAVGVALKSETIVENFMVVSDAISSNTTGYVKNYTVVKEIPFKDRFEVTVKATITTKTLEADFNLIAKSVGGVRFLVMADPAETDADSHRDLNFAVDKINSFLAERNYRYVDNTRFQSIQKEATKMMEESNKEMTYVQRLGLMADAQFIIVLSDLKSAPVMGAFDIKKGNKVSFVAKAYDNCTSEGLGSVILESNLSTSTRETLGNRTAIENAVENDFTNLLGMVTSYIGGWVNNGTPFELRFYNTGTFRDFRDFRKKLKADKSFGGDLQITSVYNYTKLNCTFKSKADNLADKILDIADEIPSFEAKRLDVKMIYGRQISFAPQSFIITDLIEPKPNLETKVLKKN